MNAVIARYEVNLEDVSLFSLVFSVWMFWLQVHFETSGEKVQSDGDIERRMSKGSRMSRESIGRKQSKTKRGSSVASDTALKLMKKAGVSRLLQKNWRIFSIILKQIHENLLESDN